MKVFVIFLVLIGITFFSIDDAFGAVGWTSQEIYDFSDIIAVGEITSVNSTFSPTMNLYHIQVEKFLKNPQDSNEILAVGSKTASIRAGNEVFDVGDRALFFLTDDIASIFPIHSEIYEVSAVSQSMDPDWDTCNIFEKNIPPNHWVFGGRNNHLQVSQENKTDDFVTGKKITISYDIFNHEPVTKKVDFGMMVKNIDEPESLYEFTETADRILEPCTVYETISWSFTPSEPANYLAEFYDLKGHTTGITIPVKSDTGFSGVAPLKQWGNDIPFDEIQCKQNLALIQKYDGSPACVTKSTRTKLIERGWTGYTSITNGTNTNTKQDNWQEKILKVQSRTYCSVMDLDRIPKDQIIYQKRVGTNALMLNVNDDDLKQIPHLQEMILAMNNSTGFVPYQYQENTLVKEISSSGESQHSMIWNWLKEMFKSQYTERQDGSFSSYFEYGKYYYDISWSLC